MEKTIYALGFFDGVHIGHQALLRACREIRGDFLHGVVTFGEHPDALVLGAPPRLINTIGDRQWLLRERFGMDRVVTLPFDRQLMTMDWEKFLDMLRSQYGAAGFVCGEDFVFGYRARGTAAGLKEYCSREGLPVAVVPEQLAGGKRISSTRIRNELEAGSMSAAVELLGHPHILRGEVIHGRALGRQLGIPTANLLLPEEVAVPRFGVYITKVIVDGTGYPAVTNIGTRPTVSGHGVTVESWLLGYEGDLYDRVLTLEFYSFLRPEQKFDSLEALQAEVRRNAEQTIQYFRKL